MRLIRAQHGSIDVFDDDGGVLVHRAVGEVGAHPGMDDLDEETVAFGDGAGIAAPIHDKDGMLGLLVMAGRQAGSDRFDDDASTVAPRW